MVENRRLAAIMFTDIEGYTALMQKSEDQALQWRQKHRTIFERETRNFGGKILQYYGDGTLSVFDSAVKAVECAVAIQLAMLQDPLVPLRIGIHSGDIIFTNDDVAGDGVNVASRVESLAVPGSIFISDKVFDEIKNHDGIQTKFLKTFPLKNVENPLGIYAVTNRGLTVPELKDVAEKLQLPGSSMKMAKPKILVTSILVVILLLALGFWIGGRWNSQPASPSVKTIAVIPFDSNSPTAEDYFPAGMTQGLIKELSKLPQLRVIDQFSTRLYAGLAVPLPTIAKDLSKVDYVVQGHISKETNQIRVQLALSDLSTQDQIWASDYESDISEIRLLWARAAADMVIPLGLEIADDRQLVWEGLKPVKPETYELYLKGTYHLNKSNPVEWQKGMVYLQEAVNQNPGDAYAYAALAEGFVLMGHGPDPPPDVFPKASAASMRAIRLDSTLADGWAALAHYETYFGWNWKAAELAFHKANSLDPNLAMNHYHRSWYLLLFGRVEEAIEEHLLAKELDPFNPLIIANTGVLYQWIGRYEEALAEVEEALAVPGYDNFAWGLGSKASIYVDLGRFDEALDLYQQASAIFPAWRYLGYGIALIKSGKVEEGKMIIKELEAMPTTAFSALCLGFMYTALGENEQAIKWFRFKEKHGWYPWIRVWPGLESLHDEPDFLELIQEMKLPNPQILRPLLTP